MNNVKPKKHLGQHFLIDHNIAKKISNTLDYKNYDDVIEIGPGKGILTKNLINQIKSLKGRIIDGKYYNFTLMNNEVKINIFFDNKSLNLIGWQTEDIYQNLVITFISSIKINQKIDKDKFNFPEIR